MKRTNTRQVSQRFMGKFRRPNGNKEKPQEARKSLPVKTEESQSKRAEQPAGPNGQVWPCKINGQ